MAPRAGGLKIIATRVERHAGHNVPLSLDETRVAREFVHGTHIQAIAIAARAGNFAVTFRVSGAATLACIATGAPCKGHDLLEKTIKESSLVKLHGIAGRELLDKIRSAGIEGRVGHWSRDRLLGLHVQGEVADFANADDPARRALAPLLRKTADGTRTYYPIDTHDLARSLAPLMAVDGWEGLAPTGDYDLHDMLGCDSQPAPVPSGSAEERHVIDAINKAVATADKRRPFDDPHLHVVQHGPQYNYAAFTMDKEPGQPLIAAVAKPDLPLALCDRGDWRILSTLDELQAFYEGRGTTLKTTWVNSSPELSPRTTLYFKDLPEGRTRLSRRPSTDVAKPVDD